MIMINTDLKNLRFRQTFLREISAFYHISHIDCITTQNNFRFCRHYLKIYSNGGFKPWDRSLYKLF
ncbi:MAG: hypothetical protein DRR16_24815 [Candidatus Parabeggiatoa sp. nov. 3]|nr:MAG: hypothetical protein DRR00_26260 [Gammaproteobacteria bacterium]RKZ59860.1 MAG: hypothetical protein DRQ99_23035 [Gammaproteobacteria bacterium]RKZ79935.1 MAG: hypothetical protein DRR16_24815 [Gammaproteobacteria bacterium]